MRLFKTDSCTESEKMIKFLNEKYSLEIYKDGSIDVMDKQNGYPICTLYDKSDFFRFIYNTEKENIEIQNLYDEILNELSS